jgi:hypothetical protein
VTLQRACDPQACFGPERKRGKRTEARDLLAPISGWFTKGFDTPNLKEAKALLESWSDFNAPALRARQLHCRFFELAFSLRGCRVPR